MSSEKPDLPVARINYTQEQLGIIEQRMYRLTEVGFQEDWARMLAKTPDIDVVRACTMAKQGCPLDTIIDILT